MSNIHFIGGEKGGVGKSFTARLLAQYYVDHQKPFSGFDTDQSHQTFSRFYGEFCRPMTVNDFTSIDQLFDAAEQQPSVDIIVDLAAQTARELASWEAASEPFDLLQLLGFKTYIWHVLDDGADSAHLLARLLTQYEGKPVQFVVVQNYGRGESFDLFNQSAVYAQACSAGAHFVRLEKLQASITQKVDFSNSSFWAATHNQTGLSTVEGHRAGVWLQRQYQQLQAVLGMSQKQEPQLSQEQLFDNVINADFA